jgi:hypothetical protein
VPEVCALSIVDVLSPSDINIKIEKGEIKGLQKRNKTDIMTPYTVSLLISFGFDVHNYSGGSHYTVSHKEYDIFDEQESHIIPMKRPEVLSVYVKRAIVWIERVMEIEEKS